MKSGRKEGSVGSKTAIVKAFYQEKTFEEALKLSKGVDEQTAALIWTACKRVEDFMYIGASDLHHDTGLDKWVADGIFRCNATKRRRAKVEAMKNEPQKPLYLTSKQYYRSV